MGGVINTVRIFFVVALALVTGFAATSCNDPFAHSRCRYTKILVTNEERNFEAEIQNWTCKAEGMLGNPDQQAIVRVIDNQQDGVSQGVFSISGKHLVTARWIDPTHLEIKCEDVQGSDIGTKLDNWGGVTITYVLQ